MYNPRPWPFDVNLGPRQRFRGDETPLARKTRCIIYVPFPLLLIAPDTMVGDSHL